MIRITHVLEGEAVPSRVAPPYHTRRGAPATRTLNIQHPTRNVQVETSAFDVLHLSVERLSYVALAKEG